MIKKIKKALDNDRFVTENFEKLVKRYGGQRIVISRGEIFIGEDAVEKAREKYPKSVPMFLPVPRPEAFTHIL